MTRIILAPPAALLALLALSAAPATAQITYPFQQPRFGPGYQTQLSPWLNMLRGGDPAANYFIGVEPEIQRRRDRNFVFGSLQGINQQLLPQRPGITDRDLDTPLRSTGHPTAFGYTGTYFGGPGAQAQGSPFPSSGRGGNWPKNTAAPPGKAPPKTR